MDSLIKTTPFQTPATAYNNKLPENNKSYIILYIIVVVLIIIIAVYIYLNYGSEKDDDEEDEFLSGPTTSDPAHDFNIDEAVKEIMRRQEEYIAANRQ